MVNLRPLVFLSHSIKDKEFIEKLAIDLRCYNIECWYSGWDLLPGDSLRRKIFEEGISGCTALFVLITENSINSEWVKKELDAGLVESIEKQNAKLLPFIFAENETKRDKLFKDLSLDIKSVYVGDFCDYNKGLIKLIVSIYKFKIEQEVKKIEYQNKLEIQEKDLFIKELQLQLKELENQILQSQTVKFPKLELYLDAKGQLSKNVKAVKKLSPDKIEDIDPSTSKILSKQDKERKEYLREKKWGLKVFPIIKNEGEGSASNIVLDLEIKKPIEVYDEEPESPIYDISKMLIRSVSKIPRSTIFDNINMEPIKETHDKYIIRYKINRLVHTIEERLHSFYLVYPEDYNYKPQECLIEYAVVSDTSQRQTGHISVVLEWD